jgi:hypothetical protein
MESRGICRAVPHAEWSVHFFQSVHRAGVCRQATDCLWQLLCGVMFLSFGCNLTPGFGYLAQVQRTCEAIHAAGCVQLRTFECLLRQYDVHSVSMSTDLSAAPSDPGGGRKRKQAGSRAEVPKTADSTVQQVVAKPAMVARGHTGYLLTARKAVALT